MNGVERAKRREPVTGAPVHMHSSGSDQLNTSIAPANAGRRKVRLVQLNKTDPT